MSDGTPGKEHAVVSAHIHSTLPSPGAADDAFSIGIVLGRAYLHPRAQVPPATNDHGQ